MNDCNEKRWKIICPAVQGIEGNAVKMLYADVSKEVPYILVSECAVNVKDLDCNLLIVGTKESNSYVAELLNEKTLENGSVSVSVKDSPYSEGCQTAVIAGAESADVLYAVSLFLHIYLPMARHNTSYNPYFVPLFKGKMPEYDVTIRPQFEERGIWTWGHCIYDYRRFAENMASLGLNSITIWNDYAPLNMQDVVDCFHSYGIKVLFGYSVAWGEKVDISSEKDKAFFIDRAVKTYAEQYEKLGGNGVYFQSFTETDSKELNGLSIADTVVDWVNTLSDKMLSKWPDLKLCFGLHATSVKDRLDAIEKVDSRVVIHWEDCGAFPYNYYTSHVAKYDPTVKFTDEFTSLRNGEKIGVVLKGQICLDWSIFEHQMGPFVLGCESREKIKAKLPDVTRKWHDVQSYWIRNYSYHRDMLKHLGGCAIYALVEDALYEECCWYPTVLYALSLWAGDKSDNDLMQLAAAADFTVFA